MFIYEYSLLLDRTKKVFEFKYKVVACIHQFKFLRQISFGFMFRSIMTLEDFLLGAQVRAR